MWKNNGELNNCVLCPYMALQVKSRTLVLLCSVTGYDASGRVDDMAAQLGKQCTSIAIGKGNSN